MYDRNNCERQIFEITGVQPRQSYTKANKKKKNWILKFNKNEIKIKILWIAHYRANGSCNGVILKKCYTYEREIICKQKIIYFNQRKINQCKKLHKNDKWLKMHLSGNCSKNVFL